jgi:murein DD-endopeptidase MepM/ murein hydrolase activator NlpD
MMSLCMALVVTLGLAVSPFASADTPDTKKKLDAGVAQLRTALDDTSAELAAAFLDLQRTRGELPKARQSLTAADAAQAAAERNNQAIAAALVVAEVNVAKATAALVKNAQDTQAVRDQLVNLVRNDYQRGEYSGLSIVLQATSPQDFTDRIMMMDTISRVRRAKLRELDVARVQGKAAQAHLLSVRARLASLKVQAEAGLAQATLARTTAAAAKTKLDLLYAAQTRFEATLADRKASEVANLAKMQAQSAALTRRLAARARAAREAASRAARGSTNGGGGAGPAPQDSGGGFLNYPVSAPVSSEFGLRLHPITGVWRLHAGIDFAASCGSPVYAAAAGEVILATGEAQSGGYGNRLVIDHGLHRGTDLTTTYNHLTRFVVSSGRVSRGQLVAYSGTTGFSTGCHLHFETRQDGTPVNPRGWL